MRALKESLVLLALSILSSPSIADSPAKIVHFVTDHEKNGGFLIEVTRAAFGRMGYAVTVQFMPWMRALRSVESGQAEALLGTYYAAERAEQMEYTASIGSSEVVFFKLRQSRISYASLADLKPHPIGTVHGAVYTPEFDNAPFLVKDAAPDHLHNIRKLLAGRVPLIVEKRLVVRNTLAAMGPGTADSVEALEPPLTTARFYNAFSRQFPGYRQKIDDFNKGLELLRRDGSLQRIMTSASHE